MVVTDTITDTPSTAAHKGNIQVCAARPSNVDISWFIDARTPLFAFVTRLINAPRPHLSKFQIPSVLILVCAVLPFSKHMTHYYYLHIHSHRDIESRLWVVDGFREIARLVAAQATPHLPRRHSLDSAQGHKGRHCMWPTMRSWANERGTIVMTHRHGLFMRCWCVCHVTIPTHPAHSPCHITLHVPVQQPIAYPPHTPFHRNAFPKSSRHTHPSTGTHSQSLGCCSRPMWWHNRCGVGRALPSRRRRYH